MDFDHPINNNFKTYKNIRNIATGRGDDFTTGCLLDYIYFKNYYKMISVDLSKQQALDADPKAIQQIDFTENLEQEIQDYISFLMKQKKLFRIFHKEP